MKRTRTNIVIAISSIALFTVLIIQLNWILQTAKSQEELFNEKTNIVLARTTEALLTDKETCRKIETGIGKKETQLIDSILTHYMNFYNFHVDHTFEIIKPGSFTALHPRNPINKTQANPVACYDKSLDEMTSKNGWELKLVFLEKKQFIFTELGTPFIISVVLILVVLALFWRTMRSLQLEKRISEHTTDFLNNMTHEFKTPLTNIALAGKMIIKDLTGKQEDKIKQYSEIILGENEKLKVQVEQVLSMTALERGEIPLRKTELDFHELITDAIKYIRIQIDNKNGSISLNLRADKFVIMGDETHLTNALCNLIDNAIKYSNEKPEISIQTCSNDQQFAITVSDKGIGIGKEHHKKVFEKFFRVPTGDVHDVKGFGLGLAYIKKIVELHQGTIEMMSEKGEGTIFTITFPHA